MAHVSSVRDCLQHVLSLKKNNLMSYSPRKGCLSMRNISAKSGKTAALDFFTVHFLLYVAASPHTLWCHEMERVSIQTTPHGLNKGSKLPAGKSAACLPGSCGSSVSRYPYLAFLQNNLLFFAFQAGSLSRIINTLLYLKHNSCYTLKHNASLTY